MIHTVKSFSVVNKTEVDVSLDPPYFLHDTVNVGNSLWKGSSAFPKSSLYIWKFLVHILLKPSLKDFVYYIATCEMSTIVW